MINCYKCICFLTVLFIINFVFIIAQITPKTPRKLQINTIYDIWPNECQSLYKALLIDDNGNSRIVKDGDLVFPGKYILDVKQLGYYSFGGRPIVILPSKKPFNVSVKLLKKPFRPKIYINGALVYKVIDNHTGKKVCWGEILKKGEKKDLTIMFYHFKSVRIKFIVQLPFKRPKIPLIRLKQYTFYFPHKSRNLPIIQLDEIKYPYRLYVDSNPIEAHLIQIIKVSDGWYYTIEVNPNALKLQVYAGYLFGEKMLKKSGTFPHLKYIDIEKLIYHLDTIAKKKGSEEALAVIVRNVRNHSWQKKLKLRSNEIAKLSEWLQKLKLNNNRQCMLLKLTIEKLKKFMPWCEMNNQAKYR